MTQIAGHRVTRVLREDAVRRVFAAFGDDACELDVAEPGGEATLAAEAAALSRVDHPHLRRVDDVASHDGRPALVRRLGGMSAATWLAQRGTPTPGEVTTLLAPIADALGALHASGVVGVRLDLHAISIDADGAPSLDARGARIESATPTTAWRDDSAAVATDCDALSGLATMLMEAAGTHMPADVSTALERHTARDAAALLLAAVPALPLRQGLAGPTPSTRPLRRQRSRRAENQRSRSTGLRLPTGVAAALDRGAAAVRTVRRRVWVLGAAGVAALLAAVVVPSLASATTQLETVPSEVAASEDAVPEIPARTPAASVPAQSIAPVASAPDPTPPDAQTDAWAAAHALLASRESCLDGDDPPTCLGAIRDAGGGIDASSWRMPPDAELLVVTTFGDAALIEVASEREPASVLIVRTEAGWLLRDAWPPGDYAPS